MTSEPQEQEPAFQYALEVLPPGRSGFRRWRWELWHGATLLATGWRTSAKSAEQALGAAASRAAHARLGLHPLHPRRHSLEGRVPDMTVRVVSGAVACLLVPRAVADARAAA